MLVLHIPSAVDFPAKLIEEFRPTCVITRESIDPATIPSIGTEVLTTTTLPNGELIHEILENGKDIQLEIRIYSTQVFYQKMPELAKSFQDSKGRNWLIVVSIQGQENEDVLDKIQHVDSPLRDRVMFTHRENGDISFMPIETFNRTGWMIVCGSGKKASGQSMQENLKKISEKINDYQAKSKTKILIDKQMKELKKLLGFEKKTVPSINEIRRLINDNVVQPKLKNLKAMLESVPDNVEEKKENFEIGDDAKNCWKILGTIAKVYERTAQNKHAMQCLKHAVYFGFKTKLIERFLQELCLLFNIRSHEQEIKSKEIELRLKKCGLLYVYQILTAESLNSTKLENELKDFFDYHLVGSDPSCKNKQISKKKVDQQSESSNELRKGNQNKKQKLGEIKNFVENMFCTKKKSFREEEMDDTGFSEIVEILENIQTELGGIEKWADGFGKKSEVKKLFISGIKQALDGEIKDIYRKLLDLISEENRGKVFVELKTIMRKEYHQEFWKNYKTDCEKHFDKLPEHRITLIVVSKEDSANDIRPIEIERAMHTGKWEHHGNDGISKRMIKNYIDSNSNDKNELVSFCNAIFHSFSLGIPNDVQKTILYIKYDKWKESELKYIYRPISNSTQFFNLLDKTFHLRLLDWIWQHDMMPEKSFSYQKRKSAPWCRNNLLWKIADLIKSKKCWYVTCIDFKQAYENVNPLKLCQIMANMKSKAKPHKRIPSKIISWVWFALRQRELTYYDKQKGENITYRSTGVPQGSSMSPLLFNIYTSLIHLFSTPDTFIYQYTDDILILGTDDDFHEARRKSEHTCYEVVSEMLRYDAVLKQESVSKIQFVGLKMKNPQKAEDCGNIETIFADFFTYMEGEIRKRNKTIAESSSAPEFWQDYHIRVRPLFTKTLVSIKVLLYVMRDNDYLNDRIKTFDGLNVSCFREFLTNKGIVDAKDDDIVRCEFGEFPAEIRSEEAFFEEFSRYYYYGLINEREIAVKEIGDSLKVVARMPKYPVNINVLETDKSNTENYDFIAYTDGSVGHFKDTHVAGAGVYFHRKPVGSKVRENVSRKLSSKLMIGSAEIVATILAIDEITDDEILNAKDQNKNKPVKILICVDREEILQQLRERQRTHHIHYYAEKFKEKVSALKAEVYLMKVKAHSNSKHNDKADGFAKQVCQNDSRQSDEYSALNLVDFKRIQHRNYREEYQKRLNCNREFRFQPWFQNKRIKAVGLSPATIIKYIRTRLANAESPQLNDFRTYHNDFNPDNSDNSQ